MKRVSLLVIFLLAGCSMFGHHKLEVLPTTCAETPRIDPPFPSPIVLNAPEFYVVSPANRADFDKKIPDGVFYAMTPEGYVIMAQNMQELRRYIRELQSVILFYKNYGENIKSKETKSDSSSVH